ncbi:hypothetical protein PTKIN_Ptkin04bG0230200 [Pterospermum kingtungense]
MEEQREHAQQMKEENPSKEGIEQVCQKEQNKEITDAGDEDKPEERVILMVEENRSPDGIGEEEEEDRNGEDTIVENRVVKAEKVGESRTGLVKKPKQGSKQSLKAKPTIPQPFSLSTEKRMSKENMTRKPKQRHGSMDFKNSQPQPRLSRSVSLSHRDQSSVDARETSDLNCAKAHRGTAKTSSRPQVAAAERSENRVGNAQKTVVKTLLKGAESKHPKKERVEEMGSSNLQKNTQFKALPLPRFYQKKDSPSKSETKKMPEIHSKSTLLGLQNCPNKIQDKGKGPTKTIATEAKGTITKLLKSTRKVLSASKVTTKGVVSSA